MIIYGFIVQHSSTPAASLVVLPVDHLLILLVLLQVLHAPVLGLHELVPLAPARVVVAEGPLLVGVPLVVGLRLVQVREVVDKHCNFLRPFEEVIESELHALRWLQQVYPIIKAILHLADDILIAEIIGAALRVTQSLGLLLEEELKLVASDDSVAVQIQDPEPVLNALSGRLVLGAVNEPNKVGEGHVLGVLETSANLRKDAVHSFSGQRVTRILRELLLGEEQLVIVVQLPKLNVNYVKILIGEEILVFVNFIFRLNVVEAFEDVGVLELTVSHLQVSLAIGHEEHSVDHARGIQLLKLRRRLQELEAWMIIHHHFENLLYVIHHQVLLFRIRADDAEGPPCRRLAPKLLPPCQELLLAYLGALLVVFFYQQGGKVPRQPQHFAYQLQAFFLLHEIRAPEDGVHFVLSQSMPYLE